MFGPGTSRRYSMVKLIILDKESPLNVTKSTLSTFEHIYWYNKDLEEDVDTHNNVKGQSILIKIWC
jgi:hypothetical protein